MTLRFETDPPDPEKYRELFETTGWNVEYGATAEDLARANRSSWFLLAAYDGQELVAFGRIVSDGVLHAMIYDMIVRPDRQGQGVGSQVLARLLAQCRRARIRDVQLFSARGKEGFYRRHGFQRRPLDAPGMQLGVAPPAAARPDVASRFRFDCVFYHVSDLDRASAFYERVLGLTPSSRDLVARFDLDGVLVELVPAPEAGVLGGQGNARLTLGVDDIERARADLLAQGVPVSEVVRVANGRLARLRDPDGNEIVLWESA